MVALTPSPYSPAEAAKRKKVAAGIFRDRQPYDDGARLPWANRLATRILDPLAGERLHYAFEDVRTSSRPKTILLDELGSLWIVHIEPDSAIREFVVTWRFICSEDE